MLLVTLLKKKPLVHKNLNIEKVNIIGRGLYISQFIHSVFPYKCIKMSQLTEKLCPICNLVIDQSSLPSEQFDCGEAVNMLGKLCPANVSIAFSVAIFMFLGTKIHIWQ